MLLDMKQQLVDVPSKGCDSSRFAFGKDAMPMERTNKNLDTQLVGISIQLQYLPDTNQQLETSAITRCMFIIDTVDKVIRLHMLGTSGLKIHKN